MLFPIHSTHHYTKMDGFIAIAFFASLWVVGLITDKMKLNTMQNAIVLVLFCAVFVGATYLAFTE